MAKPLLEEIGELPMLFGKEFLQNLERKYSRLAIRNLMSYLVFIQAAVYLANMFGLPLMSYIFFYAPYIMEGQVWRLVSFICLPPPDSSAFFIIFTLYLYWMIGQSLERAWGTFKFNAFYFCGVLGTIIGGFISYYFADPLINPIAGYATTYYLNLSLFFAFAIMFPNIELLLFFIIPVKVKYLGYINAVLFIIEFITRSTPERISLIAAVINVIIFFGGDFMRMVEQARRRRKWKKDAGNWFKRGCFSNNRICRLT